MGPLISRSMLTRVPPAARRALLARWTQPAVAHQLLRARAITVLTRPHPTNRLLAPQWAGQLGMLPVPVRSLVTQAGSPPSNEDNKSKVATKLQKLKALWQNYRWVFAAYYGVLWAAPLFPIWVGLEVGFDGVAALKYMGADTYYSGIDTWNPSIINGFIAIEINSLVDLVRLPLAISTTPQVAEWWRSRGGATPTPARSAPDPFGRLGGNSADTSPIMSEMATWD